MSLIGLALIKLAASSSVAGAGAYAARPRPVAPTPPLPPLDRPHSVRWNGQSWGLCFGEVEVSTFTNKDDALAAMGRARANRRLR